MAAMAVGSDTAGQPSPMGQSGATLFAQGMAALGASEADDEAAMLTRPMTRRPQFVRKLGMWNDHHDFVQSIMLLSEGAPRWGRGSEWVAWGCGRAGAG